MLHTQHMNFIIVETHREREEGQYGTAQDREFQVGVDQNTKKVMSSFTIKKNKVNVPKINTHNFSHEMPSNSGMEKTLSQKKKKKKVI